MAIILPRIQRHFLRKSPYSRAFMCIHMIPFLLSPHMHIFTVPDNRIGILSSSMFAGMMIGAVGWGTCKFYPIWLVSRIDSTDVVRLGPYGSQHSLQRDPIFHIRVRHSRLICNNISNALCCPIFSRQRCRGTLYFFSLGNMYANAIKGVYAYRWHPSSRAYAPRQRVPRHCSLCILLFWSSACCPCSHSTYTQEFLSTFACSL